jgi:hypothetical protein
MERRLQTNMVTGTLGERVAERRDQAHQLFEPDLEKPHMHYMEIGVEWKTSVGNATSRRDDMTMLTRLRARSWSFFVTIDRQACWLRMSKLIWI